MVFNSANQQQSVNEVYFGKTPELQKIENQLDLFRNKYMGRYVFNTNVNSDKDLLKFDRMMEDFFGLGCFTIYIVNEPIANAFTMPIDYRFDHTRPINDIVADKRGFKFKKDKDYSLMCCIYSGIIFNPDFTTEEVMACILHEVGHNFNSSINKSNGILVNNYIITMNIIELIVLFTTGQISLDLITNNHSFRNFVDRTEKKMREDGSALINIYDILKQIQAICNSLMIELDNILKVFSLGLATPIIAVLNGISGLYNLPQTVVNLIMRLFSLKQGYRNEETADNFATMYGYGPATISLQSKLDGREANSASKVMKLIDNKVPFIAALIHCTEFPVILTLTVLDEHPDGIYRCKDQLELLKREVNKEDIDPKMKNIILSDIKECEKQLNLLLEKRSLIEDPYQARKAYYRLLNNMNPTIKTAYASGKNKFDEYDDAYNRASGKYESALFNDIF